MTPATIQIKAKTTSDGFTFGYQVAATYASGNTHCLELNCRTLVGAQNRLAYWAKKFNLNRAADRMSAAA
jgi:hypothetical protein